MFLMMKLLLAYWGRASHAARQLSLGMARTVSSENPRDLALIVAGMAPSVVFFRQHLHSPVLLIPYRRTVEVRTEPLLTCSLEVSIHVLAPAGWDQSLRQHRGTSGWRNRIPETWL